MTKDERIALVETRGVTLDGQPAKIGGYSLPFAQVRLLSGKGGPVEYAWETVARIVAKGGRFQS